MWEIVSDMVTRIKERRDMVRFARMKMPKRQRKELAEFDRMLRIAKLREAQR